MAGFQQNLMIAGLACGSVTRMGVRQEEMDFYDLKGDFESIFGLEERAHLFKFEPFTHPALHPGQTQE